MNRANKHPSSAREVDPRQVARGYGSPDYDRRVKEQKIVENLMKRGTPYVPSGLRPEAATLVPYEVLPARKALLEAQIRRADWDQQWLADKARVVGIAAVASSEAQIDAAA